MTISERFWAKVEKTDGCWNWTGAKTNGYGIIGTRGRATEKAHRLSYMMEVGEIPDGMCVCHKCDNPGCVNPDHLFVGTHLDNALDRMAKGRSVQRPVFGEKQGLSKLTYNSVRRIRIVAGVFPDRAMAKMFGVSAKSIHNVIHRKTWRHVP